MQISESTPVRATRCRTDFERALDEVVGQRPVIFLIVCDFVIVGVCFRCSSDRVIRSHTMEPVHSRPEAFLWRIAVIEHRLLPLTIGRHLHLQTDNKGNTKRSWAHEQHQQGNKIDCDAYVTLSCPRLSNTSSASTSTSEPSLSLGSASATTCTNAITRALHRHHDTPNQTQQLASQVSSLVLRLSRGCHR